jgi:hypothetical protein
VNGLVALLELIVTFAITVPAGRAVLDDVSVRVPGPLAEAGDGVSQALLLVAVHGMPPVPVFCTETVDGDGEEPVGLNRYTLEGVTPMTAVGCELTLKVTGI